MRWRIIFFAAGPIAPIAIMLFVTHWIFDDGFLQRHLDTVVGSPVTSADYVLLRIALTGSRDALDDARRAIESQANVKDAEEIAAVLAEPAPRLAYMASQVRRYGAPMLNRFRPPGFAGSDQVARVREALDDAKAASAKLMEAVAACAGCASGAGALVSERAFLDTAIEKVGNTYNTWAGAKARQPAAWMMAVNATIILIVVAAGTALWSFHYVLPQKYWGQKYGYLGKLRVAAVVLCILVFLASLLLAFELQARPVFADVRLSDYIPVIPYRIVTLELFERTLDLGYEKRSGIFLWCNYISIGLVAAALFGSFTAMSVASRTFVRRPSDGPASAMRRMAIVRNMLYLAAALSVAVLLVIDTDFTAAASMFAEALDDGAPNPARATIEGIGRVIVQAYGIALGLALGTAYLPAATVLQASYDEEKAAQKAAGDDDAEAGFLSIVGSGAFGTAMRFAAIVAPAAVAGILRVLGVGA
jgi:hypothetical protein